MPAENTELSCAESKLLKSHPSAVTSVTSQQQHGHQTPHILLQRE